MDDIYEPLSRFRDELRDKHAENTAALFDELVAQSGVDLPANAEKVSTVRDLESSIGSETSRRDRLKLGNGFSIFLAVAAGIALVANIVCAAAPDDVAPPFLDLAQSALAAALSALGGLLSAKRFRPRLRDAEARIADLTTHRDAAEREAWEQMAPLNALFDWGLPARLIHQTAPRIEFDPYFTEGRLQDLRRTFGWDDTFNQTRSVVFSQSGEINGNPFVVAETLSCAMRPKTYSGSLDISWTERVRDADGRSHLVTRHQTLHASVEKPAPEYDTEKTLIYGNDAAPTLTFSRDPSPLSGLSDNALSRYRLRAEVKRLEAYSRNLDDDSDYTILANREFEALFHAVDRSDEVQFRLLFTPLAQRQMLALLRDREVGYGDDFRFVKRGKVNYIVPAHLTRLRIDTNPAQFHAYDGAEIRRRFLAFNADFFRGLYFALAPLLSIPLYQQTRTHEDIHGTRGARVSSFWEHEAIANFYGDAPFRPPQCVTRCILKTQAADYGAGGQRVEVTAHGYRGEPRTDYVSVFGGDGRFHDVPVPWTEYLPVSRTSPLRLLETNGLSRGEFEEAAAAPDAPLRARVGAWNPGGAAADFRRSILSLLVPQS